jgi:hypothetical protein
MFINFFPRIKRNIFTTSPWLAEYFWWPLSPYIFVTFLRFCFSESWSAFISFRAFNPQELALVLFLAVEYAGRSVKDAKINSKFLNREDKKIEMKKKETISIRMRAEAYILFGLFLSGEFFQIAINRGATFFLWPSYLIKLAVFLFAVAQVYTLGIVQEHFTL